MDLPTQWASSRSKQQLLLQEPPAPSLLSSASQGGRPASAPSSTSTYWPSHPSSQTAASVNSRDKAQNQVGRSVSSPECLPNLGAMPCVSNTAWEGEVLHKKGSKWCWAAPPGAQNKAQARGPSAQDAPRDDPGHMAPTTHSGRTQGARRLSPSQDAVPTTHSGRPCTLHRCRAHPLWVHLGRFSVLTKWEGDTFLCSDEVQVLHGQRPRGQLLTCVQACKYHPQSDRAPHRASGARAVSAPAPGLPERPGPALSPGPHFSHSVRGPDPIGRILLLSVQGQPPAPAPQGVSLRRGPWRPAAPGHDPRSRAWAVSWHRERTKHICTASASSLPPQASVSPSVCPSATYTLSHRFIY